MPEFPIDVGFVNELLSKKKLQTIISEVFKIAGMARTAQFLDDIKDLGFQSAYKGGLSMGLNDVQIPETVIAGFLVLSLVSIITFSL